MSPVELLLLSVAAVFFVGVVGEIVFAKTSVPDVIWLILMGVLFGPVLGWVPVAPMMRIAPYFGAVTLVVVLFGGGSTLRMDELLQSAPRALVLALLTFVASMLAVAGAVMLLVLGGALPESWGLGHALIVGAILGGSSSIVIMPAMQRAGLRPEIANTVNLESALTDVLCVVVTGAAIDVVTGGAAGVGAITAALGTSFGIGVAVGALAGIVWLLLQPWFGGSEHEYPVTLGALFVLYVIVSRLGGSAALAILSAAVVMGNAGAIARRLGMTREVRLSDTLQGFHGRITFIVKSFFFTFIGVMLRPPWTLLVVGVALGALLVIARLPAVFAALAGSRMHAAEKRLIGILLPRGMAAGVLALMPHYAGVPDTESLPVVVFAAVVTTIVVFAGGLPSAKRQALAAEAASAGPPPGSPPSPPGAPPSEGATGAPNGP